MLLMRASCSQEGRRITTYGEMVDPATGELKQLRSVTRIDSSQKYTVEMSEQDEDGNYVKTFEVAVTRK